MQTFYNQTAREHNRKKNPFHSSVVKIWRNANKSFPNRGEAFSA